MPKKVYSNHNELLLRLQDQHYSGDPAALSAMYEVFRVMAERMVRRYFSERKIPVREALIRERGHDCSAELCSYFLKRRDYKVRTPSGALRSGPFLKFMFSDIEHDKTLSYDRLIEDENFREHEKPFIRMF